MMWWLLLYFAPPVAAMFFAPSYQMFGRVWLFNLVSLFAWPVLALMIPMERH
ncbi:hypothetical protein [Rhodopseudomonas sp. B29]|uniref:hypothetical protein n=1 Tax=Rhodopseudomonas sp. B29 TaxID=95607 RepID=UPI00034A3161|nr:hypothetical protein [Rhodopseudomonas sp. B29]